MCGIFALLNNINIFDKDFIQKQFDKGKSRGPEKSTLLNMEEKLILGYHRLSVNGIETRTHQPIVFENYKLICNGEIYNYKELYKYLDIFPKSTTTADCEIIIHLYKKYGIEHTLQILDGDFAFVLFEYDSKNNINKLIVGRDPYGVRPLYIMSHKNPMLFNGYESETIVGFASEMKVLKEFCDKLIEISPPEEVKKERENIAIIVTETQTQTDAIEQSIQTEPEKKKRGRKPTKKQQDSEIKQPSVSITEPVLPVEKMGEADSHPLSATIINQMKYEKITNMKSYDDFEGYFENDSKYDIKLFKAGTYSEYYYSVENGFPYWKLIKNQARYHSTGYNSIMYHLSPQYNELEIVQNIQRFLIRSIEKRCSTTERPMACLLSGGLDSSIITGLVCQYHKTHGLPQLETYCIGMEGGEDLKYAKMVAEHLGTKHTEIIITESDIVKAIPEVINVIETYDTTTVRASIGNYLAGKYIAQHSKAKVIFNGDGADELLGGYLYMYLSSDSLEFDKECRRLLKDIHMFDAIRADKCMTIHGLESRSPYLDRSFVQYYLTIPPQIRFHTRNEQCEKYLMRVAFCPEYYRNSEDKTLLPDEVLWRTKEAFSDGVAPRTNSVHNFIHEYANNKFFEDTIKLMHLLPYEETIYKEMTKFDPVMSKIYGYLCPTTPEQYYYRREFEKSFSGNGNVVPYIWMPRYFKKVYDPSARTLPIYPGNENMYENEKNSNKDSDSDNDNDNDSNYPSDTDENTTNNIVNTNFNITINDPINGNANGGKPDFTFTINSDGITKTDHRTENSSSNVHEINIVLDKEHFATMFASILQSSAEFKSKLEAQLAANKSQNVPLCQPVAQKTEQEKPKKAKKTK